MSTHTPGPWYADPYEDDCDGIGVCAKGKGIVADVDSDYCESDEMRANAHLIAAAPDLLEACKAFVSSDDARFISGYHACVAAIAKAEGH